MIGIHTNDDLENIINAYNSNATIIQLFVNNSIKNKNYYPDLKETLNKYNMKCVVHASYTINLTLNWDEHSWWIFQFIDEIAIASVLKAKYIVVHVGKQLKLSKEESINNIYSSLLYICQQTKQYDIQILLETPAGQGTEIGYTLEEFAMIYRKFSKHKNKDISNKFGICLDTCHVFSAGYDIKNKKSREIYFDNFNELIGLNQIKLIHLNDSKVPINSYVDRHANFGNGYIGKKALIKIASFFIQKKIPIIIETPQSHIFEDLQFLLNEIL